ncbi:MAG TPA: MFS transporter, partial [Burkholderiaceae bacterium]|nr:MFS transporter [Burkholderiaceae bacterium]
MNSASVRDGGQAAAGVESGYAWFRLSISLLLSSIGASGIYVVVVVLPAVQAEFGAGRSDASLPYTLTIVGFGLGGLVIGRLTDRVGVMLPAMAATVFLGIGFF